MSRPGSRPSLEPVIANTIVVASHRVPLDAARVLLVRLEQDGAHLACVLRELRNDGSLAEVVRFGPHALGDVVAALDRLRHFAGARR